MKIIAITSPEVTKEDSYLIKQLLSKGIDRVHLRKPNSTIDECRFVLTKLTNEEREKIIVHDYQELYHEFNLGGIHMNKNIGTLPHGYKGMKTRSCHSIEEIVNYKQAYDYMFLSPIFDSISKAGYRSKFTEEELTQAAKAGIIDEKVIALGGVTFDKIAYLKSLNFGGAAMIGSIYNMATVEKVKDMAAYK